MSGRLRKTVFNLFILIGLTAVSVPVRAQEQLAELQAAGLKYDVFGGTFLYRVAVSNLELPIGEAQPLMSNVFVLENPSRLIIDIAGHTAEKDESLTIDNPYVTSLRIGKHKNRTRLVLDLSSQEPPEVKVSSDPEFGTLLVDFSKLPSDEAEPFNAASIERQEVNRIKKVDQVPSDDLPVGDLPGEEALVAEVMDTPQESANTPRVEAEMPKPKVLAKKVEEPIVRTASLGLRKKPTQALVDNKAPIKLPKAIDDSNDDKVDAEVKIEDLNPLELLTKGIANENNSRAMLDSKKIGNTDPIISKDEATKLDPTERSAKTLPGGTKIVLSNKSTKATPASPFGNSIHQKGLRLFGEAREDSAPTATAGKRGGTTDIGKNKEKGEIDKSAFAQITEVSFTNSRRKGLSSIMIAVQGLKNYKLSKISELQYSLTLPESTFADESLAGSISAPPSVVGFETVTASLGETSVNIIVDVEPGVSLTPSKTHGRIWLKAVKN